MRFDINLTDNDLQRLRIMAALDKRSVSNFLSVLIPRVIWADTGVEDSPEGGSREARERSRVPPPVQSIPPWGVSAPETVPLVPTAAAQTSAPAHAVPPAATSAPFTGHLPP